MRYFNIRWRKEDRVAIATDQGLVCLPSSLDGHPLASIEDIIAAEHSFGPGPFAEHLRDPATVLLAESDLGYRPVVERPSKIICIGLNYRQHAEETHAPIPEIPVVFGKFSNTLTGHGAVIELPQAGHQVDYEAELAIVMGRRCRRVSRETALQHVFGYAVANDVSARDLQNATSQWLAGKSLDGFCPIGPGVTTADEVGDPNRLQIQLTLNGELRQNSNTSDMIFSCATLIEYLSRIWTLEPGDVILTGTPQGVILGRPESERVWIRSGDRTEAIIEKLGTLSNSFIQSTA